MISICIPSYCGLCRFKLKYGEVITAVRPVTYEQSQTFLQSVEGFTDNTLDIKYIECRGQCHHDERGYGCHADCARLVPLERLADTFEATALNFEPSILAEENRLRCYRSRLARIIEPITKLPMEVCHMSASYALDDPATYRLLAVDLITEICAQSTSFKSSVTVLKNVYARHVKFENITYIAHLTNAPDHGKDALLLDTTLLTPSTILHIASDHLGIRRMLLQNPQDQCTVEEEVGVWWQSVRLGELNGVIKFYNDGLKLRHLTNMPSTSTKTVYSLPKPFPKTFRFEKICKAEESNRLSMIHCNNPRTTAYSLCWNSEIVMFHGHLSGSNLDFYQALQVLDKPALWLYMPLCRDELLSEIWSLEGPLGKAIALLLITDQGRSNFLGIQPRPNWNHEWKLLDLPNTSRSFIYAETTTSGIRRLGFEPSRYKPSERAGRTPQFDWPTSPYPKFCPDEFYAWNKASLTDVVKFSPCQQLHRGKITTIGLLLHYSGGASAGVGQIRLDRLGKSSDVEAACALWLGFDLTVDGPCVSEIIQAQQQPTLTRCESWFRVDWHDDLEWWFSHRQCQLYHQQHLSPGTIVRKALDQWF